MGDDREAQIRRRAYEIWEQEGRPHGEDLAHWIKALEEIESGTEKIEKPASKSGARAKSVRASSASRSAATASKERSGPAVTGKGTRRVQAKRGKGNGQNAPS
jgi:hypothetical protein